MHSEHRWKSQRILYREIWLTIHPTPSFLFGTANVFLGMMTSISRYYCECLSINIFFVLAIASAGFKPFGQVLVQFMMV